MIKTDPAEKVALDAEFIEGREVTSSKGRDGEKPSPCLPLKAPECKPVSAQEERGQPHGPTTI